MRIAPAVAAFTCLVTLAAAPASGQRTTGIDDAQWLEDCHRNWSDGEDRGHACEVRDVPFHAKGRVLEIDGRENGGVRVAGWDGDSVRVTARIQANARDDAAAQALLHGVKVNADGRHISADVPRDRERHENLSVSYVVFVPRRFDLHLEALNGAIGVTGVSGTLDLRTTNGSVALADVGGDVHAHTQNGSLNVQLGGDKWDGRGLDAETQNGSVRLAIPSTYAAQLETGTVNGRVITDFPITVQGRIGRTLSVPLNGGGATIRAMTTNGSVTLSRR